MTFKTKRFEIGAYVAPGPRKKITWWGQKSPYYKHGFVLRVFQFGFVLRYGHRYATPRERQEDAQAYMESFIRKLNKMAPGYKATGRYRVKLPALKHVSPELQVTFQFGGGALGMFPVRQLHSKALDPNSHDNSYYNEGSLIPFLDDMDTH